MILIITSTLGYLLCREARATWSVSTHSTGLSTGTCVWGPETSKLLNTTIDSHKLQVSIFFKCKNSSHCFFQTGRIPSLAIISMSTVLLSWQLCRHLDPKVTDRVVNEYAWRRSVPVPVRIYFRLLIHSRVANCTYNNTNSTPNTTSIVI